MSELSERLRLNGLESLANKALNLEAENADLRAKLFGLPEAFSAVVADLRTAKAKLEAMRREIVRLEALNEAKDNVIEAAAQQEKK